MRKAVKAFLTEPQEAGRPIALKRRCSPAMIPPSPILFTVFGSTLYGELWLGLCQALAAPWLEPCWLARAAERAGDRPGEPHPAAPEVTVRQDRAQPRPAAPQRPEPEAGQVIEVPAARWRRARKT
jgi:hypothetical protein